MQIWQAILLGIVEGLTEFLPVSSTGHLTITERLLGLKVDDPGVTAYTAIIQMGAIVAAIIYFRRDIGRFIMGFLRGVTSASGRQSQEWRMALIVIVVLFGAAGLYAGWLLGVIVFSALRGGDGEETPA